MYNNNYLIRFRYNYSGGLFDRRLVVLNSSKEGLSTITNRYIKAVHGSKTDWFDWIDYKPSNKCADFIEQSLINSKNDCLFYIPDGVGKLTRAALHLARLEDRLVKDNKENDPAVEGWISDLFDFDGEYRLGDILITTDLTNKTTMIDLYDALRAKYSGFGKVIFLREKVYKALSELDSIPRITDNV